MSIGQLIKKKRVEQNITQIELAKKVGVSRQTISNWENDRTLPDIDCLIELSAIYNLSIDQLISNNLPVSSQVESSTETIFLNRQLKRNLIYILLLLLCVVIDISNASIVLLVIVLLIIKQSLFDFFQLIIGR